jgi:hypothetical protein
MDRNDQSMNPGSGREQQDGSMRGSEADRGTSDRGMSGAGREGGYGDDTGRSMDAGGLEGGNRNDDRIGTTANQTGPNRPNDIERMQGRPSEIGDDQLVDGAMVERGQAENEDVER